MPVLDASIVVDWVAPGGDPGHPANSLRDDLARGRAPLLAPRLLPEEVANALVTGIRRARWSGVDADASFALLQQLPIQLVDIAADLDRAWDLSRRFDEHPVYDMLYVALAERVGELLVTADSSLARRIPAVCRVRVIG